MGSEMVSRLLSKGHTVTGYNRTRAKAQRLIDREMKWGDSPRAVCAAADVTFSMVTNEKALAAIMEGPDGILSARKISDRYEHGQSQLQPQRRCQGPRKRRRHD